MWQTAPYGNGLRPFNGLQPINVARIVRIIALDPQAMHNGGSPALYWKETLYE